MEDDHSTFCIRATKIYIDWEDRGFIDLLDMDNVLCSGQKVNRKDCKNCQHALYDVEVDEDDGELESYLQEYVV